MQSTHPTPSSSPACATALPTSVAWLGYGGLLPFAALAGIVVGAGHTAVGHGAAGSLRRPRHSEFCGRAALGLFPRWAG